MKTTREHYYKIAKEICKRQKFCYIKLKNICYNDDSAVFTRYPDGYDVNNETKSINLDDSIKMVPVLEIFNTEPYTYKVYDEEWLKNA